MKEKNNLGKPPFREPSNSERNTITNWFIYYNKVRTSFRKKLSWFFGIVGVCMFVITPFTELENMIVPVLCGIVCFLLTFSAIRSKKNIELEHQSVLSGDFLVISGKVVKSTTGTGRAMYLKIWFESDDKMFNNGWYEVRCNNLTVGTPIILVDVKNSKQKEYYVLSPYMLNNLKY